MTRIAPRITSTLMDSMDEQGFVPVRATKSTIAGPRVVLVGELARMNAQRLDGLMRTGESGLKVQRLQREVSKSQELGPRLKRTGAIPKDADVDEFFDL